VVKGLGHPIFRLACSRTVIGDRFCSGLWLSFRQAFAAG
jgi:hypothetical protein